MRSHCEVMDKRTLLIMIKSAQDKRRYHRKSQKIWNCWQDLLFYKIKNASCKYGITWIPSKQHSKSIQCQEKDNKNYNTTGASSVSSKYRLSN